MKKGVLFSMLIMMSFLLMSSTCLSSVEIAQIENEAESNTWIITSYIDSGQDKTNHFNGYNFTFSTNGVLIATKRATTLDGTWSVTDSNNSNDDSNDDIDFNIFFPVPETNDFEDLNDDW